MVEVYFFKAYKKFLTITVIDLASCKIHSALIELTLDNLASIGMREGQEYLTGDTQQLKNQNIV